MITVTQHPELNSGLYMIDGVPDRESDRLAANHIDDVLALLQQYPGEAVFWRIGAWLRPIAEPSEFLGDIR